jgi:hypothetical protein
MSQEDEHEDYPILDEVYHGALTTKLALSIHAEQISTIEEEIRLTEMKKHTIGTEITLYEANIINFQYPNKSIFVVLNNGELEEIVDESATTKAMEEKIVKERAMMKWRMTRVEEELVALTKEKERKEREMVVVERFGKRQRME